MVENEFSVAHIPVGNGLMSVEQSRAVAEVQASIVLARASPRNEQAAFSAIMTACKRKGLAERATYAYKRGGQLVTGPSIRLAEALAQQWGNIQYGFREVGRGADYSEVEAFAHDLQTNTRVTRQFRVRHWRDKKGGGAELTEERDKYELVASQAQRRVRSCLLELIPGDVVEAAEEACKATLTKSIGNIEDQGRKILDGFAELGVTQQDIEGYLQRKITSIVPADVVNLKRIYVSIRDGIAVKEEFFGKKNPEVQGNRASADKLIGDIIDPAPTGWSHAAAAIIAEAESRPTAESLDMWRAAQRVRIDGLGEEAERVFGFVEEIYQMLKKSEE